MRDGAFKKAILTFGLLHLGIFLCFTVVARMYYPATGEFERSLALRVLEGHMPYRDFVFEYPPLAVIAFVMPVFFFRTPLAYAFGFATELFCFDLLVLVLIVSLARRFKVSPFRPLAVYTVCLVSVGPLVVCRYDLLPAMLVLASLWALVSGRTAFTWALIALGTAAKVYPILIVPLYLIYQLIKGEYRKLAQCIAVFSGVLFLTALPWLIIDHSGLWRSMTYHLDRGLHSESSYGTALLLAQVFGWTRVEGSLTFGSWNLTSPLADTIGALSPYFTLVLLVAVYSFYTWWAIKVVRLEGGNGVWNEDGAIRLLLQFAPLVLLVFLLVNKVFSAQYLIWVCPLLPLVEGWSKKPILALFIVAASLTQFVFPYNYIDFELVRPLPVAMLAVRNLLLLVAVSVLVCSILKWRGTPVFR